MEELKQLYQNYFDQARKALSRRGVFDGVLGLGNPMHADPCHEVFTAALEAYLRQQADCGDPALVMQILTYIFQDASAFPEIHASVTWMLEAVHALTLPLIPELRPQDARQLYEDYDRRFPRRRRLPNQDKVVKALKKQAKA